MHKQFPVLPSGALNWAAPDVFLGLREGLVDQMDGDCAFAYRRGYAFHVARADVADGKYSRKACFQHERAPSERPCGSSAAICACTCVVQFAAGEDETFGIES